MRSSFIFPYIMTMLSNFMIFLSFTYFFSHFFDKHNRFLHFHMVLAALLLITSLFKLIIFIVCSLKDSQIFFIQYLPLYTSCLFSMFLNHDLADIKKHNGICSPTFVVNEFSELFFIIFTEGITILQKSLFSHPLL